MTPEQSLLKKKLCPKCQIKGNCPDCRLDVEARTVEESTEERLLSEGLSFNQKRQRFEVKCIYKSLIDVLPTYKNETLAMMKKMVEKIQKSGNSENIAKDLNGAIEKNLQNEVFLWESSWLKKGSGRENLQQSYSPCSWACKREGTTLTRLCHNLSFSRGDQPSLNDCQLTGHSNNFKVGHILLLHRGYKWYSTADVSKFYNCIHVSDRDASLQRFLWPKTKDGKPSILSHKDDQTSWESIIPQTLLFGARHSQCIARRALMKASDMFLSHRPDLQWFLIRSYTDDLALGNNKSKEQMKKDQQVITEALKKASFFLKEWETAGEGHKEDPDKLMSMEDTHPSSSSKHLGIRWRVDTDRWEPSFLLNITPRQRGVRPREHDMLTGEDVDKFIEDNGITKRQALAICHLFFDPLGIYLPLTSSAKILYRQLLSTEPSLNWKSQISKKSHSDWGKVLKQMLQIKDISIPRCGLPALYEQGCSLILSCDGGAAAAVSRAFIRADTPNPDTGLHEVVYLAGNSKLGEVTVNSAVKTECLAIGLAVKLAEAIIETFKTGPNIEFTEVIIVSDSKVVLALCRQDPSQLKLYFQSRITHVQSLLRLYNIKLLWTEGKNNDSDAGSKIDLDTNYILEPTYFTSKFFFLPKSQSPVEKVEDLSKAEEVINTIKNTKMSLNRVVLREDTTLSHLLNKFNNFDKIIRVLAYVRCLGIGFKKSFVENLEEAKLTLLELANPSKEQIESLKKHYEVQTEDNVEEEDVNPGVTVVSRPFNIDNRTTSFQYRAINGNSTVGRILLNTLHVHCMSPQRQQARAMEQGFYIIGAIQHWNKMSRNCWTCRRIRGHTVQSPIGASMLLEATRMGRFSVCTIDMFGFLRYKEGRSTKKLYFLTVSDHATRYTIFKVMMSASAESLMMALQNALDSVAATCHTIVADSGTNIVPIKSLGLQDKDANDDKDDEDSLNMKDVQKVFRENKISFKSSTSSPWRQTHAEKLHHLLKISLKRANLSKSKSYSLEDWIHVAARMTRLINDRPLTLSTVNTQLTCITSNKLIFGCNPQTFDVEVGVRHKLYSNLINLQADLQNWENIFKLTYVQEQLQYLERLQNRDTLQESDVVMITDHLGPNKQPALGFIHKVMSPRTFLVKYVKTEAKTRVTNGRLEIVKPATLATLERPAQKLVYLGKMDSELNLDPFVGPDANKETQKTPQNQIPQKLSIKQVFDDQSQEIKDLK